MSYAGSVVPLGSSSQTRLLRANKQLSNSKKTSSGDFLSNGTPSETMAELATTEFATAAPRISLYTPESRSKGQLIVVCTWLGALPKHVSKYLRLYQSVSPKARILLVQSNVGILTSRYGKQRAAIQPAVSIVLETLAELGDQTSSSNCNTEQPRILVHAFSNGGTNTATHLLMEVRKRLEAPLRIVGIVFDSCPARGTYKKSYDAMIFSLPRSAVSRVMGPLVCHGILIGLYTLIACGVENPASLQRRTLVDADVVQGRDEPGGERVARACYIYSKADRMCDWHDVADHAELARSKGWAVRELIIEDSGHCAHMPQDQARYANAMIETWADASSKARLREKSNSDLLQRSDFSGVVEGKKAGR